MTLKIWIFNLLILPLVSFAQMIEGLGNDHGELVMVYDCVSYGIGGDGFLEEEVPTTWGIMIENSLPRGDRYLSPDGTAFGSGIFWNRITNHSQEVLEVDLMFPPDSFLIPALQNAYYKLYLPPDSMSVEKEKEYNYGATGLTAFLDKGLHRPTVLRRDLRPGESILFYTGVLSHNSGGVIRTGYVLEGDQLFYRVQIKPHMKPTYIPCGSVEVR